jgi:hypothetical protein
MLTVIPVLLQVGWFFLIIFKMKGITIISVVGCSQVVNNEIFFGLMQHNLVYRSLLSPYSDMQEFL